MIASIKHLVQETLSYEDKSHRADQRKTAQNVVNRCKRSPSPIVTEKNRKTGQAGQIDRKIANGKVEFTVSSGASQDPTKYRNPGHFSKLGGKKLLAAAIAPRDRTHYRWREKVKYHPPSGWYLIAQEVR